MAKRRTCIVDGQAESSIAAMCERIGINTDAFYKAARNHGLEFNYRGHHFILSPENHRPNPDYIPDPGKMVRAPSPGPLEIAMRARKLYDDQGVARVGLLARRPA